MTDTSAQACREAAAELRERGRVTQRGDWYLEVVALLLAAAEQREQLDAVQSYHAEYIVDVEKAHAMIVKINLERLALINTLTAQLATLTAERDLLTKVNARVTDLLAAVTAERDEANAHEVAAWRETDTLREQVATLTAERDELKTTIAGQAKRRA